MSERSDRVFMPETESRCAATHGCRRKDQCGRFRAEVGKAPLADYSIPSPIQFFGCMYFVPLDRCKPRAKLMQPRVFPPIEGIV